MRRSHPKVDGKKPKCAKCGHLLEKHTKTGACDCRVKARSDGSGAHCLCKAGPR